MPHAALVAAAQMDAKRHAVEKPQNLVVRLDRAHEIFHRVFAALRHFIERRRIDIGRIAGRVDLHVTATGVDQTANHLALDPHDVGNKVLITPVNGF